jgi:hypothetical protein
MGLLKTTTLGVLLASAAHAAVAADWRLALDLRAVRSDGRDSFLEDGQGKLRFDDQDEGLRLGRWYAAIDAPLGESFAVHVAGSTWDDDDKNPFDLTEAWLEYRPVPRAGFKPRLRLGAFYPPMSLESRAAGWETPYTITPSAIGSWIGEEIRTVGLEGQLDWLGTRLGHSLDLQLTAALFGWNDPAGTMLATHGFALHDRQTTLFGRVGAPRSDPTIAKKEVFREMDDRPGFYVGAQASYLDRVVFNFLRYDNRADPSTFDAAIDDFAWLTKFDAAALRLEGGDGWTAILQALEGDTWIAPGPWRRWRFDSQSALLARRFGMHMLAARYDAFAVEYQDNPRARGSEDGHAWTVAYTLDRGGPWRFALEWLRVTSDVRARIPLGESPLATESKIEFSARYTLAGSF